jgi:hypothetical protein
MTLSIPRASETARKDSFFVTNWDSFGNKGFRDVIATGIPEETSDGFAPFSTALGFWFRRMDLRE